MEANERVRFDSNPGPFSERRVTLPGLNAPVIPPEQSALHPSDHSDRAEHDTEQRPRPGDSSDEEYRAPKFHASDYSEMEEPLWPEGLLEAAYHPPRRRRWTGIVVAVLATSLVLVVAGAVLRFRSSANTPTASRPQEATQQPTTTATPGAPVTSASSLPLAVDARRASAPPAESAATAEDARTAVAPTQPPRAVRRAARRKVDEGSTWRRQEEPERGIPVNQVFVNQRGELVDARGQPLNLDTARPHASVDR
jgi:hypothetical protein